MSQDVKKTTELLPIKDNLHYIKGVGGNIGVLTGTEGIVLVDDQFESVHEAILAELATISTKKVKYIINTHWHVDHTNGNERFGALGCEIIAHQHSHDRMTSEQYIAVFDHHQQPYAKHGLPTFTFQTEIDMEYNGETIHLFHMPHAHTNGDLIVQFKKANVIHTGDIFVTYGYPFIDTPNGGSIYGVLAAIDKILALCDEETIIIPGHGVLAKKKEVVVYRNMLITILQRVESLYRLKKSRQEILATHPTRGYSSDKINEAIFVDIILNAIKNPTYE